jgi:thiamine transport system permease protein
VTLPLLVPSLVSAFLLVFIYSFLSFGIVLVFGGIQFSTFEVKIFEEMNVNLDLGAASVYALLQLLFSFTFIFAVARGVSRSVTQRSQGPQATLPSLAKLSPAARAGAGIYLGFIVLFLLGPIVTMTLRAFSTGAGLGIQNFAELFVPGASPRDIPSVIRSSVGGVILRSVLMAAASGTLTMAVTVPLVLSLRGRRSPGLDSTFQIPIGISFVTLALGLRLLYGGVIPHVALVVMGQVFIAFPIVFRILRSSVEEVRDHYVESAQALGAKGFRLSRDITLPLLRRPLMNAFAYSLAIPFADLTIVLTVGAGRITTFPVAIYRLIGFRSFDVALALGVVYLALCLVLFRIIDSTSR